jgi:hypothetical protein
VACEHADASEMRLASRLDRVPPSHGDWMPGLRANGFVVEALHELSAPEDAQAHEHYDIATAQWAGSGRVENLEAAHFSH